MPMHEHTGETELELVVKATVRGTLECLVSNGVVNVNEDTDLSIESVTIGGVKFVRGTRHYEQLDPTYDNSDLESELTNFLIDEINNKEIENDKD